MSAEKHTPGPWSAQWDDNGQWYIEPLGLTGTKLRGDCGDCLESANAHLIAAAPLMLETLQTIADFATGHGDVCEIIAKRVRAALAAARGEK